MALNDDSFFTRPFQIVAITLDQTRMTVRAEVLVEPLIMDFLAFIGWSQTFDVPLRLFSCVHFLCFSVGSLRKHPKISMEVYEIA